MATKEIFIYKNVCVDCFLELLLMVLLSTYGSIVSLSLYSLYFWYKYQFVSGNPSKMRNSSVGIWTKLSHARVTFAKALSKRCIHLIPFSLVSSWSPNWVDTLRAQNKGGSKWFERERWRKGKQVFDLWMQRRHLVCSCRHWNTSTHQ